MTIDPKDLRSGDKFTVEFVVPDLSTVATHPVLGALEGGRRHYFKHSDITSITRAPEPLKVGDRVSWGHKLAPYRLVAIDGDFAWVRAVDGYGQQLIRFSDLERIP